MKAWRRYAFTAALALAGATALFVSSCSTLDRSVVEPPRIEGAHFVGNKTCADCHTNIARIFPASPHARFYKDDLKWAAGVAGSLSIRAKTRRPVSNATWKFTLNSTFRSIIRS